MASAAKETDDPAAAGGFVPLVRIDLRHEYFAAPREPDGPCRAVAIAPTEQTRSRLSRFGLLLRERSDGIDILYDRGRGVDFAKAIADDLDRPNLDRHRYFGPPLLFALRLRDPALLRYSDLPDPAGGGLAAVWPTNAAAAPDEDGGATIVVDAAVRLLRRSSAGPAATPEEAKEAEAEERSRAPRFLAKGGLLSTADIVDSYRERWESRRRSLPLGYLDIHLTADSAFADPSGPFPVSFDPRPPQPGPDPEAIAGAAGRLRPVRYRLRFAARRARRRYLVAPRDRALPPAELAIAGRGTAAAVAFEAGPPVALPDGRAAQSLASAEPMPLRARPEPRFALTGIPGGGGRRRILVDPLPEPAPETFAAAADGAPWSDIHVFV